MTADLKDSPEIIEFRRLFARLREWSDDDASALREIARGDDGVRQLALDILRLAGTIQRNEKSERDLFTGPVDPKFISGWRDFEEVATFRQPFDMLAETTVSAARVAEGENAKLAKTEIWLGN